MRLPRLGHDGEDVLLSQMFRTDHQRLIPHSIPAIRARRTIDRAIPSAGLNSTGMKIITPTPECAA
jgi:hypothetical protein